MARKNDARTWPVTTNWIDLFGASDAAMTRVYSGESTVAPAHAQLKPAIRPVPG